MNVAIRVLLAALSGCLITHAHVGHPATAWVALVALAPLYLAMFAPMGNESLPPKRIVLSLGAASYFFSVLHMYSLTAVSFRTYTTAIGYLMLGGLLFAALCLPGRRLPPPLRATLVGAAWVLADVTRTLGSASFPALLGSTLVETPPLGLLAAIGGPWLLDFVVAAVAALLAEVVLGWLRKDRRAWASAGVAAFVVLAVSFSTAGALALTARQSVEVADPASDPDPGSIRVAVLQGSVPAWTHREGWRSKRVQQLIDHHYAELGQQAASESKHDRTFFVLPESAFGRTFPAGQGGLDELRELLPPARPRGLVATAVSRHLSEGPSAGSRADREDVVLVFGGQAHSLVGSSGKSQMVPMHEAKYQPVDDPAPIPTGPLTLGSVVCWESLYPAISRGLAEDGADVLVVFTNDSVQRLGKASAFHARLTRLRAIETGRPLIYASQAGPTWAADSTGQTREIPLFEVGIGWFDIRPSRGQTFYLIFGDLVLAPFLGIWLATVGLAMHRRRQAH